MLFEIEDDRRDGPSRWSQGLHVEGRIHLYDDILMWRGGVLGWLSSKTRMAEEGKQPLEVHVNPVDLQRLAACWNAALGLDGEAIARMPDVVDVMASLSRCYSYDPARDQCRHRHDIGASEACMVLESVRRVRLLHPAVPLSVAEVVVEDRGMDYRWGLLHADGTPVTDQTFTRQDAERLALCWNALDAWGDPAAIRRGVDLSVRAATAVALGDDCLEDPEFRLLPESRVVSYGAYIMEKMLASGSYLPGRGMEQVEARLHDLADAVAVSRQPVPGMTGYPD